MKDEEDKKRGKSRELFVELPNRRAETDTRQKIEEDGIEIEQPTEEERGRKPEEEEEIQKAIVDL